MRADPHKKLECLTLALEMALGAEEIRIALSGQTFTATLWEVAAGHAIETGKGDTVLGALVELDANLSSYLR